MWRGRGATFCRLTATRVAVGGISAAVGVSTLTALHSHSHALAEAATQEATGESPAASKPQKCLNLMLHDASQSEVLACYPPEHTRVVADRVLVRPCMKEELKSVPLRPLAVVEDGSSQSILIVPTVPLWQGPPDLSMFGRVGYPVLPISIAQEEQPPPPSSPPTEGAAASTEAAPPATTSTADEAPKEEEGPTLWEQIEEPWRMLEAHGVLLVERDDNSLPTRVSLPDGAAAWQGKLPSGPNMGAGELRTVTVRLIDEANANRMALRGESSAPECGFCRFMKNGPCGEEFILWEKCVDEARDAGKDFVDACGKSTLALKMCTDKHPEYYGVLSDDKGDDDQDGDSAPPPETQTKK